MKNIGKWGSSAFAAVLAVVLTLGSLDADAARRLGGGRSVGQQSNNVTQRDGGAAAPTQNAAGAQQQANRAATPAAGAAAQAAAPKRPWGAMLGGLAAGLGLAWLASSLGLGAGFAQFLMFGLLALVIMGVVGAILRARQARRAGGAAAPASGSPFAFQGAAGSGAADAAAPRQYSPEKVGNDASARPFERNSMAFQASPAATGGTALGGNGGGSMIGSALAGSQNWGVPADFDTAGFLAAAKRNFVTLQDAWDRADIGTLRSMMTDGMVAEIQSQLSEREAQTGGQPNQTDVVLLEAQLLGIEELDEAYLASVEFSGMIREEPSAGPSPFREVWNMSKSKRGNAGWVVAGVQALQ